MTNAHRTIDTVATGRAVALGHPWPGIDPFIFVAHHDDRYPRGDGAMAPVAGADPAGWNMYHGTTVPGFPVHPHRGFETITIVRRGIVDHADSTGAGARYGAGDVQWVTAGRGVNHSEMFPLLDEDSENPLELYQIWINLPGRSKLSEPEFKMLWHEDVPVLARRNGDGNGNGSGEARVRVIAGRFGDAVAPAPPRESWAAEPRHDVNIWLIDLDAGAELTLPDLADGSQRVLYVHGPRAALDVAGQVVGDRTAWQQTSAGEVPLRAEDRSVVLVLQGVPIGEPVAQHGPFVMTDEQELVESFAEYRRTGFGGWPWPSDGPVYDRDVGRFARYGDGRVEVPSTRDD